MPSTVKVKVNAARNLPVMDRLSYLTDAFVEVRLGSISYKTEVARRTLNPTWNTDWFKLEVDDEELQEQALQIRVLDHDTYSSHDAIGRVYFDLNPLLDTAHHGGCINGWFPIYDTMHGIRGEIHLSIRVESFVDSNKYRQSSVGVKFFYSACLPVGYRLQTLLGFVEELVINDDPEYQWKEKLRTNRASNEARQTLFNKINGELQRKLGLKVIEMGGNAVVGYRLHFDIEGQTGVVVRGIGTAALLTKSSLNGPQPASGTPPISPGTAAVTKGTRRRVTSTSSERHFDFQSSDLTPSKADSEVKGLNKKMKLPAVPQNKNDILTFVDFPFLTLSALPTGFVTHLGGVVASKSVKLLGREEVEQRDAWWNEIRTEVRSHMRSIGCQLVIDYHEEASICEDVIVLSAAGTAVTVNWQFEELGGASEGSQHSPQPLLLSLDRARFARERSSGSENHGEDAGSPEVSRLSSSAGAAMESTRSPGVTPQLSVLPDCAICHTPYNDASSPITLALASCGLCGRQRVPDIIFSTCEPPCQLQILGRPALVQARVCRPKREDKGEAAAKEISDALPFIEYELYNQLVHKLKLKGMNSIFGLRVKTCVGEDSIVCLATGTCYLLAALPIPHFPKLNKKGVDDQKLNALQNQINAHVLKNKEFYHVDGVPQQTVPPSPPLSGNVLIEGESDNDSIGSDLDLGTGPKDTFVIEVDDVSAEEVQPLLDGLPPTGVTVATTERLPGEDGQIGEEFPVNLLGSQSGPVVPRLFTLLWRSSLALEQNRHLANVMEQVTTGALFKLRRLSPCIVSHLDYSLSITDEKELQIMMTGACLTRKAQRNGQESKEAKCIITPLCRPPGKAVEAYLGNMDCFFVRETTNLREFENLSGFVHLCMAEVQSVVRAHALSIGANAVLSYHLSEAVLVDTPGRNQAQCLLNVCGDMALVQPGMCFE